MKYGEFMAALRLKGPKPVYLLAGEEPYYIQRAEAAVLAAVLPEAATRREFTQVFESDPSPADLIGLIETAPFFTEKNVVLIRGTKMFNEKKSAAGSEPTKEKKAKKGPQERAMERLLTLFTAMPETSCVIFESNAKPDKRRKIYKALEKSGAVLDAEPERAWTIDEWLRGKLSELGRQLDREARAYFLAAVGMMQPISLGFLDQELEKLALYTPEKVFTRRDLEQVFASVPEVSGFSMLDAVSARDGRKALTILERQLREGVFLPLILAGLARHVRQLWQAKTLMARGVRGKALGAPLELNPYIAEKLGKAAEAFDEAVLHRVFLKLADADYRLKTGGGGPELLEEAVIALCRP